MRIKFLLFLFVVLLASSCGPIDYVSFFYFKNLSDKDVWIVLDFAPKDERITTGSDFYKATHKNDCRVSRPGKQPWSELVRDSMHLYVLDASKVELSKNSGTIYNQEIEGITQDMILARMKLLPNNLAQGVYVVYP